MRGYIYEVGKRPDDIGLIRETDLYDLAGRECDYVFDESPEKRDDLLDFMKSYGAEVGKDYFILTDEVKENIFAERFTRLKGSINEMNLHDFATMDCGSLKELIDDPYYDAIYEKRNSFNTIDRWIRIAETGVKYYVGNVVGMH